MVIRNKDGSVYKLRGPSEAMKSQNVWDRYTTHNMKWGATVQSDETAVEKAPTDFKVRDSFVDELSATAPRPEPEKPEPTHREDVAQKPSAKEPKVVVVQDRSKSEPEESDGIKKSFVYCLPSVLRSVRDSLYDEEFVTVDYADPFSFEAVIVAEDDLGMSFWSTARMERESVVFPKTTYKRWWRVVSHQERSGGSLYLCRPSDFQPHFEGV